MIKKIILIVFLFFFLLNTMFSQDILESAKKGDLKKIIEIVSKNPDSINKKDKNLFTAIHHAAKFGSLEIIKYLHVKGAKLNLKNIDGETPIHYAAGEGFIKIVDFLLNNKVDINIQTKYKNTPLDYAIYFKRNKMVSFLCSRGCNFSIKNSNGETPLDKALEQRQNEISQILKKNGAKHTPVQDPEIIKLNEYMHRIAFVNMGRPNVHAIISTNSVLLIDTGYFRMINKLKKAVSKIGNKPVKFIINTHMHPDHVRGNSIGDKKCVIINWENLKKNVANKTINLEKGMLKGKNGKFFEKYYSFNFNNEKILIIPSAGIHTKKDLLLYFKKPGILFMGDLLISESFPSVYIESEKYLRLLEKLILFFPEETIFAGGHGEKLTKDGLIKYKKMLKNVSDLVNSKIKKGESLENIRKDKIWQKYDKYKHFIPILDINYWIDAVYRCYEKNFIK